MAERRARQAAVVVGNAVIRIETQRQAAALDRLGIAALLVEGAAAADQCDGLTGTKAQRRVIVLDRLIVLPLFYIGRGTEDIGPSTEVRVFVV